MKNHHLLGPLIFVGCVYYVLASKEMLMVF